MSSSRIFLPLKTGAVSDIQGNVAYFGGQFTPELKDLQMVDCVQTHRPDYDFLISQKCNCIIQPEKVYATSMLTLSRFRMQNRMRFAQAWMATECGGTIIVSGNKTDGVDAFLKEIAGISYIEGRLSKAHGKVFWLVKPKNDPEIISNWLKYSTPKKNSEGYYTSPGLFSADSIDPGSRLLADQFGEQLKGDGADLGAGWGYLSHTALKLSFKINRLDLFEANLDAVTAAKMNVPDERAEFHWCDVPTLKNRSQYDFVISNPPFHETRKSEPQIGKSFIQVASNLLKKNGALYIVANRHLPYESTLDQCFRRVEKAKETNHYKVLIATAPKYGKP